ncbi:MAG: DUF1573 domain-containing protein [Muribaculaceae bacterium]|nr:DUF1573 domain-containing protein [Muribaculaceae bacterium]
MKPTLRALCLLAAVSAVLAAGAEIKWLADDYDFGAIKEVAGPKTGSVRFVNLGPEPTVINRVRPSCGCTGAEYTEGEIMPGDTATVSFTYNPKGRPGRFEKTVKVYTGADNDMKVITIRGTVIGAPETLSVAYPVEVGPLRLSTKTLRAGDIRYGTARHVFLQGYNQSADTIYPRWNHHARSLSIGESGRAVAPGDLVTFSIYFNTREGEMPGEVSYPIEIVADSAAGNPKTCTVMFKANVTPDTSGANAAQLQSGPSLAVSPARLDLGTVGDRKEIEFTLTNTGKSELHVKRIQGEGFTVGRMPVRLKPGKSGVCKGSLRLTGRQPGPFAVKIQIVSDDPVNPLSELRVSGIRE